MKLAFKHAVLGEKKCVTYKAIRILYYSILELNELTKDVVLTSVGYRLLKRVLSFQEENDWSTTNKLKVCYVKIRLLLNPSKTPRAPIFFSREY